MSILGPEEKRGSSVILVGHLMAGRKSVVWFAPEGQGHLAGGANPRKSFSLSAPAPEGRRIAAYYQVDIAPTGAFRDMLLRSGGLHPRLNALAPLEPTTGTYLTAVEMLVCQDSH